MGYLRDLTIRKKMTLMLLVTSTMAVLLASLLFYWQVVTHYRQTYEVDLSTTARMVGHNCTAALSFNIPEDAERVLAALETDPSVVYAAIADKEGKPFAAYSRKPGLTPPPSSDDLLQVSLPIYFVKEQIGAITLYDDMAQVREVSWMAFYVLVGVTLLSLGIAYLVGRAMQGLVSRPILNLAAITKRVSEEQDYGLRAEKSSEDEVGQLVMAFNGMLDQIALRDAKLRKSERRFRSLVDQAVDAFFLLDLEGRVLDVNQRACELLGYSIEELLAMTIWEVMGRDGAAGRNEQTLDTARLQQPITVAEEYHRKDGSLVPVEVRLGLLTLGDQSLIMGLARDISERLRAEEVKQKLEGQLQQAQKMESIGTLAGGIAHDFNNILTGINGYTELALLTLGSDSPIRRNLEAVLRAGHRARELVRQILAFSRQTTHEKTAVEIHLLVKETMKLLRASIPATIEIREDVNPECGSVLAEPTHIHQVLMNLCTNAYYAMRDKGGVLGVALDVVEIEANDAVRNFQLSPGSYVRLTVSDTGHGMERSVLERIFDPYFTTKPQGEGTGLGLSVVHGIVKSYGGNVTVYSEPDKGTVFQVYLPQAGSVGAQAKVVDESVPGGTERIMVVDDEESLVAMEKDLLEGLGYRVTACTSAKAALELFRREPLAYDLVITDMTMPKMTGAQMAKEMLGLLPELPIILCTGYSDLVDEETVKTLGIQGFVMKPFAMGKYARTIRSVLDRRGKAGGQDKPV